MNKCEIARVDDPRRFFVVAGMHPRALATMVHRVSLSEDRFGGLDSAPYATGAVETRAEETAALLA